MKDEEKNYLVYNYDNSQVYWKLELLEHTAPLF